MSSTKRLISLGGALACGVAIGWGAELVTAGRFFEKEGRPAGALQAPPAAPTASKSGAGDASAGAGERLSADSAEFLHELRASLELRIDADREIRIEQIVNSLAPEDFSKAYLAAAKVPGAPPVYRPSGSAGEKWIPKARRILVRPTP